VKNAYLVLINNKIYTRRDVNVNENYAKLRDQGKSEEEINNRMLSIMESLEEVNDQDEEEEIEDVTITQQKRKVLKQSSDITKNESFNNTSNILSDNEYHADDNNNDEGRYCNN
jgi:TPP-dependent 2-oxoacid decarboxylase